MILLGSWVCLLSTYSKFNPRSSSTLNYTIRNFRWYFLRFHWLVSMILSEEINENWKQWEQGYLALSSASSLPPPLSPLCPNRKGHLEPNLKTQWLTPMACPSVSLMSLLLAPFLHQFYLSLEVFSLSVCGKIWNGSGWSLCPICLFRRRKEHW